MIQAASPDSWSGLGLVVRQVRPWLKKARVIPVETARPNPEVIQDKAPRFPGQNRCYSIFQFGLHDLQMSRSPVDICATACRFLTANHSEYEDKKAAHCDIDFAQTHQSCQLIIMIFISSLHDYDPTSSLCAILPMTLPPFLLEY